MRIYKTWNYSFALQVNLAVCSRRIASLANPGHLAIFNNQRRVREFFIGIGDQRRNAVE